jgi:hypothetical protein
MRHDPLAYFNNFDQSTSPNLTPSTHTHLAVATYLAPLQAVEYTSYIELCLIVKFRG